LTKKCISYRVNVVMGSGGGLCLYSPPPITYPLQPVYSRIYVQRGGGVVLYVVVAVNTRVKDVMLNVPQRVTK